MVRYGWQPPCVQNKTARYPQPGIMSKPPDLPEHEAKPAVPTMPACLFTSPAYWVLGMKVDGTTHRRVVHDRCQGWAARPMAITDLNNLFGAIKFYKEGRGRGVGDLGAEVCPAGRRGRRAAAHRRAT